MVVVVVAVAVAASRPELPPTSKFAGEFKGNPAPGPAWTTATTQRRSNRSRVITLSQAATKSCTNFSSPSRAAYTSAIARS